MHHRLPTLCLAAFALLAVEPFAGLCGAAQPSSLQPSALQPSFGQGGLDRLQRLGQGSGTATGSAPEEAGAAMELPDWIQPGVRIVYYGGASVEGSGQRMGSEPTSPVDHGSAGLGYSTFDIHAVDPTFVIALSTEYLQEGTNRARQAIVGAQALVLTATEAVSGTAFFMPPNLLAEAQSAAGITVQRGPYAVNGEAVQAVQITVRGADFIAETTYDAESGLKLAERRASGPLRRGETQNEFNRRNREHKEFVGIRRIEGPWWDAGWPESVGEPKELRYRGRMVHSLPGLEQYSQEVPVDLVMRFTRQGPGWLRGTSEMTLRMPGQRMEPQRTDIAEVAGALGGTWMHPDVLRSVRPGVIDRDPMTGCITRLQRTASHATLTVETTGGSRMVAHYRLSDGLRESFQITLPAGGAVQVLELSFQGRR